MRSTVAVVTVLLTILITSSSSIEDKENFNEAFLKQLEENDTRKEGLTNAVLKHSMCQDRLWSCQKPCRAQVPLKSNESTPQCTIPHPGESCFGVPIDYNYVPSRESLPVEYEVLKRFPKCWSVLGPMLCGLIYRPCGVYTFTARLPTKTGKLEVWQRYGIGMCTRVIEQCEDAIKEGFFPSQLIDCKRTAENATWIKEKTNKTGSLARYVPSGNEEDLKTEWDRQTVFTEEICTVKYAENASRHEPMQCIFPLVYTIHEKIAPVIDKCFLPCRNPLISSPEKFLSFQIGRAFICFATAFICMAIFCHLFGYSKIFVESDCIYAIACSFLAFAVYLVFWGLGSFPVFAKAAECTRTVHGIDIRSESESTWCAITAVAQHVSLLCTIGFLSAAYALSAAAATRAAEAEEKKKSEKSSGFRFYLTAAVVIVSSAIGILSLFLQMVTTDGVSGVCSVGLHSVVGHLTVVALPGLAYCIIGLAVGARATWRERKQRESDIADTIVERVREGINHERAKKKIEEWESRGPHQKEDLQEQIRAGVLAQIEERTEGGESAESREKEEARGDERTGEEEILVLKGDEDEEREWLSEAQKREIAQTVRKELTEEWKGREKRAWHAAISSRYTLAAVCICMGSLIFGLCVHYASLANSGRAEVEAIKAYITCVMSKSIVRKDLYWLAEPAHAAELWHEGRGENDPLERRHNLASELLIHDCAYPSSGDGRIFGLLTVFVLLPALPLTVLIWAFGAGLVGFGGMPNVKLCRPKPVRSKDKDLEMTALTTERDDDSQMMSSVASVASSSVSDVEDDRHRRRVTTTVPSSTASTRLTSTTDDEGEDSEGGGSSTHTSVSMRGELGRFASTERLLTVRAPSEVPSSTRSEQAAVPPERTRTERHHRRLDIFTRGAERRGRSKKKSKKRASVEERNARRDGVAESGQLAPARAAVSHPPQSTPAVPDDARSLSSYTSKDEDGRSSRASSHLAPPSEAGRIIRANYEALMLRANLMTSRPGQLQDQLQIVTEEHHLHHTLHLRAPPKDGQNDRSSAMSSDDQYWLINLHAVRDKMQQYSGDPVFQGTEQLGYQLVGLAIQFARNSMAHGTAYERANYMYLQYAFDRLQTLAFHLQRRITAPQSLVIELSAAVTLFGSMIGVARPHVDFERQLEYDAISMEADQYRQRANEEGLSEEQREEVYREMLMGTNLRIVRRLMGLPASEEAIGQLGQAQAQQQAPAVQGQGRPPVYAPARMIDLTQPPEGAQSSSSSEASFSVTNSTVPSSLLSSADDHPLIRRYVEAQQPPPGYPAAAVPGAAAAVQAPPAASTGSATNDFIEQLRRAGNTQGLVPPGPAYARQSAAFPAPTSSDNGMSSLNDDDEDSEMDVMSSETSMDSMGRPSGYFSAGSYGRPTWSAPQANGHRLPSTSTSVQPPGVQPLRQPGFNLFGNVNVPPPRVQIPSFPGARPMQELQEAAFARDVEQGHRPAWTNGQLPRMMQEMDMQEEAEASTSSSLSDLPEPPAGFPSTSKEKKRRKESPLDAEPSCSKYNHRRPGDDSQPPPRVGRVRVLGDERVPAVLADLEAGGTSRRGVEEQRESDDDSGVGSVDSDDRARFQLYKKDGGVARPATNAELKKWNEARNKEMNEYMQKRMEAEEQRKRDEEGEEKEEGDEEEDDDDDENDNGDDDGADDDQGGDEGRVGDGGGVGPPAAPRAVVAVEVEDEARRRARMELLNNRYLNHSDPDLAMADEERERAERERERERERAVEREDEERRAIQEARQRLQEQRVDRAVNVAAEDFEEADAVSDDVSLSSTMSAGEQRQLVRTVRAALDGRSLEGMSDDDIRLIQHLRLALNLDGNISREAIMRYRVDETNRLNRERHNPDNNNPYRLSSVVMSRMSLAEIGARVDAIRSISTATLYPLEIFYQLHLADVLWPLAGRHIVMGDNVYTHDEINRVIGADSPMVPPGSDRMDFHQLMRKRAITAASLTGRSYGAARGTAGFQYQPPRLPDQGMYQLFADPLVLVAAMEGDLQPIREAIQRLPLTMPDVMRLDNLSENTIGSHLRHFRDYLDEQARQAGFALRPDTYLHDAVPPEPTGSRNTAQEDGAEPPAPDPTANRGPRPDPNPDPDADPEF